MRIVTIAEAKTRVGEQLSAVHGTIKSVFKRRTGEGQYGPYSFQDVIVKDATGEMPCTFASYDELKDKQGSKVTISAKSGDKGLTGLMVKDESYTDKKTDQIKEVIKLYVTGSAFVDFGTTPVSHDAPPPYDNAVPMPADYTGVDDEEKALLQALAKKKAEKEATRLAEEARQKAAQASQPTGKSLTKRDVQIVNLFRKALKGAVWACDKEGVPFWTESVATIFIAMRDDGVTDSMPVEFQKEQQVEYVESAIDKALDKVFTNSVQPDEPEQAIDQEPKTWREVEYKGTPLGSMTPNELSALFDSFKPKINPKTKDYEMGELYIKNALIQWKNEVSVWTK